MHLRESATTGTVRGQHGHFFNCPSPALYLPASTQICAYFETLVTISFNHHCTQDPTLTGREYLTDLLWLIAAADTTYVRRIMVVI